MRLLTSILLAGLLFTVSVTSGHSSPAYLQQVSLTSYDSASSHQLIVKGGHPGHRGSGRLESCQGMERSLS